MNSLGLYIKEAIRKRDEISVPGMGVFTKKRIPAYFDALQDKFMPPITLITFHEEEGTDDFFVNFIAHKEDIAIDKALSKLAKELDVLRFDLERNSDVLLEGLGRLSKKNGKLVYSPVSSDNEFKAYEPIAEAEILGASTIEKEVPADLIAETVPQDLEQEPDVEPQLELEPPSSRRRLWPAIAVAVCIVLAGFWFLIPSLQQPVSHPIAEQKMEIIPALAVPDSISGDSTKKEIESPLAEDSTTVVTQENISEGISEPQERFEIIIAAFNTMKEAQEYVARTNAKGHQVYILKNNRPSNLNKISYSSFKTEKEATLALAKVRKELTAEAWIYKRIKNNNQ